MKLELGAKADVNNIDFSTGGGAMNAAVTFARQGIDSIFMGAIGHDPAGVAVLEDLDKEGVDSSHVSYSAKYNTGYSVLLLAPSGERTILTYRGASTHHDAKNFNMRGLEADWLYVSSMAGSMEALDTIFTQARQKEGMRIFFNPGKGELKQPRKLKALLEELVRHLLHYVPVAIVSDGPNGVIASDGKTIVRAGMYQDVRVVDRTGAGDAFGSGFLSQWAQGKSLKDSIVFGSANSTSVVTKIGAKAGILTKGVKLHEMPLTEKAF
jgi:sugar/nucleoside kinase (ribokinase family)